MFLFLRSQNKIFYIPENESEHPVLGWNKTIWKNDDAFDILNHISEDLTLVQLMDSLGNANDYISIVGHWIFDSKYNKELFSTQELLDIIQSPSIYE